jgi:hypothetical protein
MNTTIGPPKTGTLVRQATACRKANYSRNTINTRDAAAAGTMDTS